ncbi:MAG: glycogen/starch synthase [Polyangiaceae bacterium]|jgi:starch synthase|nr:glycogen/starch synthase [Polyangiaceae bacterium]
MNFFSQSHVTRLTIHNLAYQGIADASLLRRLGIGDDLFHPDGVEFYGKVNILKAGIGFADAITTVSDTYALEITTAAQGRGLEGVLVAHASKLTGIVNGVDYSVWNPATDPAIPCRFDAEDPSNKGRCKTALLKELALDMAPARPLAVFCGRLVEQKGIDILLDALPKLMCHDLSLALAGDGDNAIAERIERACSDYPGRLAFVRAAAEPVVHRMLAAADLIIVPSRFEPCGVVQQYGQRYGAIPVAHATGGLIDTVVDCDAALEAGTGFLFDEPSPRGIPGGVQRALAAYASPRWHQLRRRVMRRDLGWDRSAHRYAQIYRSLMI